MKKTHLKMILTVLVALIQGASSAQELKRPENYLLVWSDEFNKDGLPDPTKWVHDTHRNKQGWYNNELQYYAAPRAENAVVKNGVLKITARKEALREVHDWGGQRYTSARLITKGLGEWTYGFFEVRAKLPCGQGTWPAIWTVGAAGRWPEDGELDIMEHMGRIPQRLSSAVHVKAGHGGQAVSGASQSGDACQKFHLYQMHWTVDGVSFGVDGKAHLRFPKMVGGNDIWPFDANQFLILNLAIGGDLGGAVDDRIFPLSLEIDYVRVYQKLK
jgi:beta-glucanase (GH16 family)